MQSASRPQRAAVRLLAGALLSWAAIPAALGQSSPQDLASPPPGSPKRFKTVPPFRFVERGGEEVTREDLAGAPWIAVPFFVACTGPCPGLTTDLRARLYEPLEGTGVRIVSFSVDPKLDTPEALRRYAAQFSIDSDRWLFLTGEEQEMHAFLREGLWLPVERASEGVVEELGLEYGKTLTHSTRLPVIDSEGRIAGWYECARSALGDDLQLVDRQFDLLLARVRALAASPRAGRPPAGRGGHSRLPLVNALLNGTAFVLLLLGWRAIRSGRRELHARIMVSAFVVSAAFLACYLYYHLVVLRQSSPTRYHGAGWRKGAYLAMLASHVVLAIVNLPLVLRVLWLARRGEWERHKRLARKTFPIWLYVSVTGVLVYLVLYHWNPVPA